MNLEETLQMRLYIITDVKEKNYGVRNKNKREEDRKGEEQQTEEDWRGRE